MLCRIAKRLTNGRRATCSRASTLTRPPVETDGSERHSIKRAFNYFTPAGARAGAPDKPRQCYRAARAALRTALVDSIVSFNRACPRTHCIKAFSGDAPETGRRPAPGRAPPYNRTAMPADPNTPPPLRARALGWLFLILPHHLISAFIGFLAALETPLKNPVVRWYIRWFKVDMSEAANPGVESYPSFKAFFTRALKDGARPIDDDPRALVAPCDGLVCELGRAGGGRLLQAKGLGYGVEELVGPDWGPRFAEAPFCTIFLAPGDYHRVHMPAAGRLRETIHMPGRLFSVMPSVVGVVPRLFVRNERVVCVFDTAFGALAVVMVGAVGVGTIELAWRGVVAPRRAARAHLDRSPRDIALARGAEMGRFNLGSTVILLAENPNLKWTAQSGQSLRMGETLGVDDGAPAAADSPAPATSSAPADSSATADAPTPADSSAPADSPAPDAAD